jgi:hypothetical protein
MKNYHCDVHIKSNVQTPMALGIQIEEFYQHVHFSLMIVNA